jgi:hypothetical protein
MNIRLFYEYIFQLMNSTYFVLSLILGIGVAINVLALVARVLAGRLRVEATPDVVPDVGPASTPRGWAIGKILRRALVKRQSTAELARKAQKAKSRTGPTVEEVDYVRRLREDLNRFYSNHDQGQL